MLHHYRSALCSGIVFILPFLFLVFGSPSIGDPVSSDTPGVRGMTTPEVIMVGPWEDDPAEAGRFDPVTRMKTRASYPELALRDGEWSPVDTLTFCTPLQPGERFAIQLDHAGDSLVAHMPPETVIDLARQAIDYAPTWLEKDLQNSFSRLDSADQAIYAQIILDAVDPHVDEIAFVIAHTATEVISLPGFNTSLLTENAETVYAHDVYLDYVDIVDYGSAAAGGDYYSTTSYYTAAGGTTTNVELPRERYYWDIVHPKITDESPTFINPATGTSTAPPTGRFWREFIFTHADSGYPVLRDELAGCLTLWEGNVDSQVNGAIGIITGWIHDVLDFGSGAERPIQPVRIYRLHLGRCGEHADFAAAAGRAALIPTNSSSAPAEDHTWNEFWDGRWIPWEPVNNYVDSGWHYEGWGKVFTGVYNWAGSDWIWTVTPRYSLACSVTVAVTDSFGYPVDGALVRIGKKLGTASYVQCTYSYTDHDGLAGFALGDSNSIFCRIESDLGDFPSGPLYKRVVTSPLPGEHYLWERSIIGNRPIIPVQPAPLPVFSSTEYRIEINWAATDDFIFGRNQFTSNTSTKHAAGGAVEFFICDAPNFGLYTTSSDTFSAYEIMEDIDSVDLSFVFPAAGDWYAVLSNEEHTVNKQIVEGSVVLYSRDATGVANSSGDVPHRTFLNGNRPNPFNPSTSIAFSLVRDEHVEVAVYDIAGRLVRELASGRMAAGDHEVQWNGTNTSNEPVAAGIYFCRLETADSRLQRKMALLK